MVSECDDELLETMVVPEPVCVVVVVVVVAECDMLFVTTVDFGVVLVVIVVGPEPVRTSREPIPVPPLEPVMTPPGVPPAGVPPEVGG